ncbi:VanW family protein [Litorihabitans aurantiacus]|uniref:YoaR-like putative peptidoglycan binding domain-containing protein n=1 Tax=Litorihabitans aurantiacus TaxID=1930061 RepID=A0AA37UPB8_9MICO|nr:VanW family protein [Litorihabitans aurantiacus]GMA30581.1 hypothetical protein GCM10025875_05730 [Litorihabitans aurantiacus]
MLVLGGAYVAAVLTTADRLPREAVVAGVDVSGQGRDEAVASVEAALADRTSQAIPITVGDVEASISPADAGLRLDAAATVDRLTGAAWNPADLYTRLLGSDQADAVTLVDQEALGAALADSADVVAVPPVDATIGFADGAAVVTDPADGSELDVPGAVTVLSEQWLTASSAIDLPVTVLTPSLGQSAVDTAMSQIVDPLLSGPVTVQAGDLTTELDPATISAAATVTGQDGAFSLALDAEALAQTVSDALPEAGQAPKDASFTFADGRPQIVPSENGTGIDPAQLGSAVQAAATSTSERTAAVELVGAEAEFSTADAEALGVTEVIGEFSTPLPPGNDAPRTGNISTGAEKVTGVLLKPGETFSLIENVGPINAASGYRPSGVVENGNVSTAYGGGLSQLSTTLFNAAFEAGLEDVEHKPHTRWFARYPEGREATLFEGSIDMRFTNTTEHGVLVQAFVDGGRTWARMWGTPTFSTEITTGSRYALRSPSTVYNTRGDCTPEGGGQGGFSVDVRRVVTRLDGSPVADKTYSTTYVPWNRVVCGPDPATLPPAPSPEPPPEGEGGEG